MCDKGTVLIVDDESAIIEAVRIRLADEHYHVKTAFSGIVALKMLQSLRPDVIVIDVRMPDMDGFELNHRLKESHDLAQIPVIFLSSDVQGSSRQAAKSAGAFGYLTKPYQAEQLIDFVDRAVNKDQTQRCQEVCT